MEKFVIQRTVSAAEHMATGWRPDRSNENYIVKKCSGGRGDCQEDSADGIQDVESRMEKYAKDGK